MERRRNWLIGIALFSITMVLYWPATTFPFVNYDDQLYVYENSEVVKGLSWNGIKWAATAVVGANWHPLTVLSHMADCSAYRLFAGGHHLTNILLHSTNAVLLWLLLRRLTGLFWPSTLAAALFAWHPLNVESVAWIAERKNVLSTLFLILVVWAYLRYAENPRLARYALTLALFGAGLAAKPMLVTVPFLLLLLDYWPLQRIGPGQNLFDGTGWKKHQLVLWEKIPFVVLSVADGVVTYVVQSRTGSVQSLAEVPFGLRLLNIPVAYVTYLIKAFWPTKLCVFYALPENPPVVAAAGSLILLVILTVAVWHWRLKFRWLLVGWFWFLGTLVPVVGLVQTGTQALADRHAYVPLIGLFLAGACGINEWLRARPQSGAFSVMLAAVFLSFCLVLTRQQLMHWRDSVELFTQAVAVNPDNATAQDLLGAALTGSGRPSAAIEHYAAATRLRPGDAELQYHLGRELIDAGRFSEAENPLSTALRQMPDNPILHNSLGVALAATGQPHQAEAEFSCAIRLQPDYSKPYFNLGKTLLAEGQSQAALTNFARASQLDPDWPEALENLASAYAATGNPSNAVFFANLALKTAQARQLRPLADRIATELKAYQKTQIAIPQNPASQNAR